MSLCMSNCTKQSMPLMLCHPLHMYCGCIIKVWQAWDIINTPRSCSSKLQCTQAVGPDLVRTVKPPSHPQDWVCCYVKNHRPWMCCHLFYKLHGCMGNVQQAWYIINTHGCHPSKPQSTLTLGPFYAKIWCIWGGWICVVPLLWLKATMTMVVL